MVSAEAAPGRERPVDPVAAARTRARLEAAERAPWFHQEVAKRMAERLALILRAPQRALDVWPHAGGAAQVLREALPHAGLEPHDAHASLSQTAQQTGAGWWRRLWPVTLKPQADAQRPSPSAYDLVWANMLLHHVVDPLILMRDWYRQLDVNGYLMFSTLGPGSLGALRSLYADKAWGPPMGDLVDMHDIGDMLVEAGFADPVMDQETVRLSWSSAAAALAELRELGANLHPDRAAGLRTPRWRSQLLTSLDELASRDPGGRVVLDFEVVYGHAVRPPQKFPVASETRIELEVFRRGLGGARTAQSR